MHLFTPTCAFLVVSRFPRPTSLWSAVDSVAGSCGYACNRKCSGTVVNSPLPKRFEDDWVSSLTYMLSPEFFAAFVTKSDIFKVRPDQALPRIVAPIAAVVRLSVGKNNRRAGTKNHFGRDLPELDVWQMVIGVDGLALEDKPLYGLLYETLCVVVDVKGYDVMSGVEALPGIIQDCCVSDAESTDFALLHLHK